MNENIKRYRLKASLTQAELAHALGYETSSIVAMWEAGTRKVPSDKLMKLASLLGCSVEDLLKEKVE